MANLLSFFGGDNTILILIVLFFLLNGGGGFFHNDDSQLILILLIVLFCFAEDSKFLAVKHKKAFTWIPSIRDFFISLTALRDRARSLSPLYLSRLDIQAWVKPSIVPNITIPPIK